MACDNSPQLASGERVVTHTLSCTACWKIWSCSSALALLATTASLQMVRRISRTENKHYKLHAHSRVVGSRQRAIHTLGFLSYFLLCSNGFSQLTLFLHKQTTL